jgi:hypothetical protein
MSTELDDAYFALAGQVAETVCLARHNGYVCTEEPGHDGWHRAEYDHGEVVDTWPQGES